MYYFTLHFLDEHLSYQIFVLITVRSVIVAYVANNNRALSQSVHKENISGIFTSLQQCFIAENKGGLLPDFMHMQYC